MHDIYTTVRYVERLSLKCDMSDHTYNWLSFVNIDTWGPAQVWGLVRSVSINSMLGFTFGFNTVARLCW